ncbi:MAG: biotin/lipoyl-binding protein [Lachnospiraceae bacterium]|nr:biotin/lipoyl-binding protein [Lachnospiraceae bacterium]
MKNYRITVNGTAYDVAVEELGQGSVASAPVAAAPVAAKAAPAPVAATPTPAAPKASGTEGNVKVAAPMPGKILGVKASVGQAVKRGDVIIVLEAMKMENEVVAPEDGTVASINVSEGANVESGDVLATLN